jgi:two-component system nitrogen regulation response regulator GlnG
MTIDQTLITQSPFAKQASAEPYPTATIIYHADIERIGEETTLRELKQNQTQGLSRLAPLFAQPYSDSNRSIADPYISRKPLQLSLVNGGLSVKKPVELTGNVTVNSRLLVNELFIVGDEWRNGVVISMSNRVVLFIHHSPERKETSRHSHSLMGESSAICKLRQVINRVSDLHVPVLIRGETGTGKELVAQAIHKSSHRNQQRFVSVNVAAIPESLAVSELFGSKKGAFTGATKDRAGYFQQADKGTLFLDEIGDAHEQVQVALLRTLETGDVTPVGSSDSIHVDVRLVAATDADLEKSVQDDRFRSPLLQRLAGFEIRIPALRNRRDDIGRLLIHFLKIELENVGEARHLENSAQNISFWAGFFTKACLYNWPGNVRQLKNIAQQLAIYNRESDFLITPDHINELFSPQFSQYETIKDSPQQAQTNETIAPSEPEISPRRKPSTVTEEELVNALKAQRYDLKATAQSLNISRAALYKKIENTASVKTASDLTVEALRAAFLKTSGNLDMMVDELHVSKAALKRRLKDLGVG